MGAVFHQGQKLDRREGCCHPRLAGLFTEGQGVLRLIGHIQAASIQADDAPLAEPGTLGVGGGDGLDDLIVQLPDRFPSQANTGLGNAGPDGHLGIHGFASKPLDAFH